LNCDAARGDLLSNGLRRVGLLSNGLRRVGLLSNGLRRVGLLSNGLRRVGLLSNGLLSNGLRSYGLRRIGRQHGESDELDETHVHGSYLLRDSFPVCVSVSGTCGHSLPR
jgi:hypothetical protein